MKKVFIVNINNIPLNSIGYPTLKDAYEDLQHHHTIMAAKDSLIGYAAISSRIKQNNYCDIRTNYGMVLITSLGINF